MNLHKELCIKTWEIMAEEGYVCKSLALKDMGFKFNTFPPGLCFACEYVDSDPCEKCPVPWEVWDCSAPSSSFDLWEDISVILMGRYDIFPDEDSECVVEVAEKLQNELSETEKSELKIYAKKVLDDVMKWRE